MSILKDFMSNNVGCIVVSVLLGLGLATMFHKVCVGRDCVIVKGPSVDYVTRHIWRSGQDCFKYKVQKVKCPEETEEAAGGAGAREDATDDVV